MSTTPRTAAPPRLTIGLPVWNGERFLRRAVDSLLAQDFHDFELILADNASTDDTASICKRYEAQDPRVRYVRQPHNLGAAPNYNFVVAEARGELFKWAACDDEYAPTYLSACIALLDSDSELVAAHTQTLDIDEESNFLHVWNEPLAPDHPDVAQRFRDHVTFDHECFQIFGVIRTAPLRETKLIGAFTESDRVTLAELALRGRLRNVQEPLFLHREHPGRSVRVHAASRDRMAWFDTRLSSSRAMPAWRLGWEYSTAVLRAPLPVRTKLRCLVQMRHWLRRNWIRMARNVARVSWNETSRLALVRAGAEQGRRAA